MTAELPCKLFDPIRFLMQSALRKSRGIEACAERSDYLGRRIRARKCIVVIEI